MKYVITFFLLSLICNVNAQKAEVINTAPLAPHQNVFSRGFNAFFPDGLLKPELSTAILLKNSGTLVKNSADKIESVTRSLLKYSMLMNVEVESLNNHTLYNYIDQWFGTPYRMGGSSKYGIDCSSFTASLFENIYSMIIPRQAKQQFKATVRIKKQDLKEGDLVFFNTRGGISHVGVFLTNGNFVHSSSSKGVTISNLSDPYYSKRFKAAGRLVSKS